TGAALPEGAAGEVVFTTLTRHGMPLIRYRTGDVSQFIPGACPCGTQLKTLAHITHRLDGRVTIGAQRLTLADLDEILFSIPEVLDFAAAVTHDQGHDCLKIEVQLTDNQALNTVVQTVSQRFAGVVQVAPVATIPATMAKRRLVDRRRVLE
ncbi:MAG TPA: hypothetical protein VHO69_18580, partial [Phototrophicaceae bacterium]|nr:hypothetical protein [Phototrophicaceae bacterium]